MGIASCGDEHGKCAAIEGKRLISATPSRVLYGVAIMATPAGRTLYKKKDGILTLTGDNQTVTWTPNSGGPPTVSLPVASITSRLPFCHRLVIDSR